MRKILPLLAVCAALSACTGESKLSGDDPNRNDEGPGEGRPMDSNPSMRERSDEVPLSKQRVYESGEGTEQSSTAPPVSQPEERE